MHRRISHRVHGNHTMMISPQISFKETLPPLFFPPSPLLILSHHPDLTNRTRTGLEDWILYQEGKVSEGHDDVD